MGSIKEALSIEKNPHLCEVSYSSNLYPSEDPFLKKLVEKSQIPNSTVTIQIENAYIGRKKAEDGEIGIFGAEKYFNGGIDEESIGHQHEEKQELHLSPPKVETQAQTPSLHSNSSRDSQSALLQSGRKNSTHNKNAKWMQGKSLLSTISCCSCGNKNPVDIDDHKRENISIRNFREEVRKDRTNKSSVNPRMEEMQMKKKEGFGMGVKKEDCFSFPILNPNPVNLETKLVSKEEEDKRRMKAFQMFDSRVLEKRNESISLERKLDLFNLGINARREEIDLPPNSNEFFEGFESDCSSDLFEIESFTTTNNSNPRVLRQSSGCVTPVYAPSEASIEWSVVTASAADFSFVSDSDYPKSSSTVVDNARKTTPSGKGNKVEERRMGIFSGCKSQKAITVVEDAYKTNGKEVSDASKQHKTGTKQIS